MANDDRQDPAPIPPQPALSDEPISPRRRSLLRAVLGLLAVGGGATLWWQATIERKASAIATADRAAKPVADSKPKNPGYVGMQACAACHAERVAEFRSTRHCLACCPPQAATMAAAFGSQDAVFTAREPSLRFEMTRSGEKFFQTAIQKTPQGERRTVSQIDLVYGAGAGSDEVYLTWNGDRLYELPVVWLPHQQTWGASYYDRFGAGNFSRPLTHRCLECHATWVEHTPGALNQYNRQTAMLGVTCEKCHGPGRDHVAYHEARPEARAAEAIVNPAGLSRERQMDLCASCHSNSIIYKRPMFSYRPGEPLDDYFRTLGTKRPEDDHVANQVSYLRESKCYQHSETLSCTTCHDPHQPRKTGAAAAQSACLSCHQAADCGQRPKLPPAVQDNCVGCHMPVSKKLPVFFQTEDEEFLPPVNRWEHRIGVYPAAQQELLLAWHRSQNDDRSRAEAERLAAALNEHWLSEGDACRRDHRLLPAIYAFRQALLLQPDPATRAKLDEAIENRRQFGDAFMEAVHLMETNHIADAIPKLEQVLAIDPAYAKAHGKLGAAYAALGRKESAVEHLQAAAKYDPDDPYGPGMLGWLAYLDGRFEEALKHYHRAEEIEPFNAQIHYQIGLALAAQRRWSEAEQEFARTLEIDPNHAGACQGLSHALAPQGRAEEALHFALRAARLTQFENSDILITLADCYANADRPQEAGKAAAKAMAAAQASKTRLAPELRLRLELLQDRAKRAAKPKG